MKVIKVFFGIGGLLLLMALCVGIYIYFNINQLVKETVEREGPGITNTSVQLDSAGVQLFQAKAELNDFVIGNPEGFDSDYLLRWEKVLVDADPRSLQSDVIVLENVVIQGIKINAEQKGLTTNLQKLLANLDSGKDSTTQKSDNSQEIRLAVERLNFTNNSINLITEKYGRYDIDLPAFDLTNLGSRKNGLTPAELGQAILKPLIKQAKGAAEDRLKSAAKDKLNEKLESKKDELETKVDEKKSELKDTLENKAKDKFKDILKRD